MIISIRNDTYKKITIHIECITMSAADIKCEYAQTYRTYTPIMMYIYCSMCCCYCCCCWWLWYQNTTDEKDNDTALSSFITRKKEMEMGKTKKNPWNANMYMMNIYCTIHCRLYSEDACEVILSKWRELDEQILRRYTRCWVHIKWCYNEKFDGVLMEKKNWRYICG